MIIMLNKNVTLKNDININNKSSRSKLDQSTTAMITMFVFYFVHSNCFIQLPQKIKSCQIVNLSINYYLSSIGLMESLRIKILEFI